MANILVYALHYDGAINKNSLGAVSEGAKLASALGGEAHAILLGENVPQELATSLGKYGAKKVLVADGPEGLAIRPKGDVAVSVILAGSNNKPAWFYHRNGHVTVLKIDGKKVTKTQDIEVGGLPEAVLFTPDGKYILAGNYMTQDFSILKVNGTKVTDTGKRFKVPGHPASARIGH